MADLQAAGGMATIGLGLGQALAPQATARVFGLGEFDGPSTWVARLLGTANIALGAMALDPGLRHSTAKYTNGVLLGNAAVTLAGAASGSIPKRTAVLVLGFIAGLAAAEATASS